MELILYNTTALDRELNLWHLVHQVQGDIASIHFLWEVFKLYALVTTIKGLLEKGWIRLEILHHVLHIMKFNRCNDQHRHICMTTVYWNKRFSILRYVSWIKNYWHIEDQNSYKIEYIVSLKLYLSIAISDRQLKSEVYITCISTLNFNYRAH